MADRVTDETRGQVIAALLLGQGVNEVSRNYKIPKATVSRIKKTMPMEHLEQIETQKKDNLAEYITSFLDSGFNAINNVLKITENDDWLVKQPAAELATFVGVTADKLFRVLEAIENAHAKKQETE